ncbi:hypothetical protein BLNAU_18612 [Blattamonas nauphoetae]|uniref:Uncharacterized protein n=1 Tax=Blattamonas nauphoetae TaxID=2049346 RepID=A0ABQ9X439_9EUKA|nr:hypothetical protein BLNAU_18612 [Blattamonas nauphoetae]
MNSTFLSSLSEAIQGLVKDSKTFELIRLFLEMLLESVILKAAVPVDLHANTCEYVFDTNGHASLVINPGNSGLVYRPDDEHLEQHIQEFLGAGFSQEIRQISRMFTETSQDLDFPPLFKAMKFCSTPIHLFFSLLSDLCETPPTTLSFLHNPLFVPHFHDLHLSFVEESPGPSEGEFRPSSIFPSPFELSSLRGPNSHNLLHNFLTDLCTFKPETPILMAFELAPPNDLVDLNNILHPSPTSADPPRPFLLPLSEPQKLDDGTVYLKALENMKPLSKFTEFLVSGKISVFSQTVIMWYIQCVLGVDARFNLGLAGSPLQRDDIFVDRFFRFHINPLPSLPASPRTEESTYSLSSEIRRVSQYFVELINKLNKHDLIPVLTIDTNKSFHSVGVTAITSLVENKHLPSVILEDLDSLPSIQSPNIAFVLSQRLHHPIQWISDILRDLQDWHRAKQIPGFDRDLLNDSLSNVLPDYLLMYHGLFYDPEVSRWNDFLNTLNERSTGEGKESNIMFLTDDLYQPARASILSESQLHLRSLGEIDRLRSDPTIPHSDHSQGSEATTASYQFGPRWDREDIPKYALKADENRSQETAKLSSESNKTESLRTQSLIPLAYQSQDGELQERLLSHSSAPTVKISPIILEITDPVMEDDKEKCSRQTEEEKQIRDSIQQIFSRVLEKNSFSWNFSISRDFYSIDTSKIDMTETFDHTLFDTIYDEEIDKSLQRCLYILLKTGRADNIQVDASFVDSLCACLGGDDEQCCQRSFALLTILYDDHLDEPLKERVLQNLKDTRIDKDNYQAIFLLRVHDYALLRNTKTFSYSDVNWEHVSYFKPTNYTIRLSHMSFVRDAVIMFRNRCSLNIFNPQLIVGRLVDYYHPFSLTKEEIAKFSQTVIHDYLTNLFTSIIVFSITLNHPLPPHIIELYADTPTKSVGVNAMNHFHIPVTQNLDTRPFSYQILERFVRYHSEDSVGDQISNLSLGVINNHFDTNSVLVVLHPLFFSHLWRLDVATMMQVHNEYAAEAVNILRSSFAQSTFAHSATKMDSHGLVLYAIHTPPQFGRFLDSLITFHTKSQPLEVTNFLLFADYINFCSPFGDGRLFQHLIQTLFSPLTPVSTNEIEQAGLTMTIRWLNLTNTWLPKGFDNPLLRFLTLSALSNRRVSNDELSKLSKCGVGREYWFVSPSITLRPNLPQSFAWLCVVARMGHWNFDDLAEDDIRAFVRRLLMYCLSPYPAIVSLALIALSNIVANTGPSVHHLLFRMNTIDVVISSVEQSSHLDDYEAGLSIISGLLRTRRKRFHRNEELSLDITPLEKQFGVLARTVLSLIRFLLRHSQHPE